MHIQRSSSILDFKMRLQLCILTSSSIFKVTDSDTFYVQSQDTQEDVYVVDMHIEACSCKGGVDGSPCSYQATLSHSITEQCTNFISR